MSEIVSNITETDAYLIHRRSEMVIKLAEAGLIPLDDFYDIFEAQKRPDVIQEERVAYSNPDSKYDDSPLGRLFSLYIRMGGHSSH